MGLAVELSALSLPLSLLTAWAGCAVFIATALYLWACRGGDGAAVLSAQRWPWVQVFVLPYRAVAWVLFHLARSLRHDPTVCPVAPGLFIGPRLRTHEIALLEAKDIHSVLDLAVELPPLRRLSRPPFVRHRVAVLDRMAPSDTDLDAAVTWALSRLSAGDNVFVHCAFGRGRSALVTSAILIAMGRASDSETAEKIVKSARTSVRMRPDQRAALERFAQRHRHRTKPPG